MKTASSRITSKFQTTIPKAVRENLKLSIKDTLNWEIAEDKIIVRTHKNKFLHYKNSIKTGAGDIEVDRELARRKRAEKYR
jgi:AbrB family looped-hinge helix DNA binding protein